MGLDFSHGEAHWSYSGFHRFRHKLAKEIGIENLDEMEGFGGPILWDGFKDPIVDLLSHSDCDGDLLPEQCKEIASRLRVLTIGWEDPDYDKQHALFLAKGMDLAYKKNEKLYFG